MVSRADVVSVILNLARRLLGSRPPLLADLARRPPPGLHRMPWCCMVSPWALFDNPVTPLSHHQPSTAPPANPARSPSGIPRGCVPGRVALRSRLLFDRLSCVTRSTNKLESCYLIRSSVMEPIWRRAINDSQRGCCTRSGKDVDAKIKLAKTR